MVPNASNAAVVSATIGERLAGFDATARRRVLPDLARGRPGSGARGSWRRSRTWTSTALRYYAIGEGHVAAVGAGGAHRLHRRGRLRAVRRRRGRHHGLGRAARRGPPAATCCPAAWAPATRSGSRRACRSTATSSTATATPIEAGLGRVVKLDKPGGLRGPGGPRGSAQRPVPGQLLAGLDAARPGIARHGYPVYLDGGDEPVGVVTSGSQSPTLGEAIAMACAAARRPRRRVPWSRSASAPRGSRRRSSRCRSTAARDSCRGWPRSTGPDRPAPQRIDRGRSIVDVPEACATPTTTSGCAPTGRRRRGHHRLRRRRARATSSSWSCPRSGATLWPAARRSGSSSRSRPRATSTRPSRARWSRSTTPWAAHRSSSTATPTATAGCIRLRLVDPARGGPLMDADAYRALIGG